MYVNEVDIRIGDTVYVTPLRCDLDFKLNRSGCVYIASIDNRPVISSFSTSQTGRIDRLYRHFDRFAAFVFLPPTTITHSTRSMVRYYPEHYLLAPVDISLACLSPSAGLLALARGPRISLHPLPKCSTIQGSHTDIDDRLLSVYTQDGPCDASALVWLTEKIFVTGYIDGTVVFTSVTVSQESAIYQPDRFI